MPANKTVNQRLSKTDKCDKKGFILIKKKKKKKTTCRDRDQCGIAPAGSNMLLRIAITKTQLYMFRLHHYTSRTVTYGLEGYGVRTHEDQLELWARNVRVTP